MKPNENHELTDYRIKLLEDAIGDIRAALQGINSSLGTLTALEIKHQETREALGRAFTEIASVRADQAVLRNRLDAVERDLPQLRESSRWIKAAAGAVILAVGGAVLKLVIVG